METGVEVSLRGSGGYRRIIGTDTSGQLIKKIRIHATVSALPDFVVIVSYSPIQAMPLDNRASRLQRGLTRRNADETL